MYTEYLNDIFVNAHFAPQNLKWPDFRHRAHLHLGANSRRGFAQVPPLLLAESWNVEPCIQKIVEQGLGDMWQVCLVGTVELVHENVDEA